MTAQAVAVGVQRQYDRQHWQLFRIRVEIESIPLFPWLFRLPAAAPVNAQAVAGGRSGSIIVNIGSYIGFGWTSSRYLFSHGSFAFPIPFAFFISGPDNFFFIIIVTLH